jgi:ABC-type uncharacterized transport system permease subunit
MKLSKKTKIRIRKAIAFARTTFLVLFFICLGLAIGSIDSESLIFPLMCFGIGLVCFLISYAFDILLFETAWSGDPKSPFHH